MDLYIYSPIRLHRVMLNYFSIGTTLSFFFTIHLITFCWYSCILFYQTVNYSENACKRFPLFLVGLDVLTAVSIKSSVVWDITPSSPLRVDKRFGGDMFLRNVG
jgi:hypothetical protein